MMAAQAQESLPPGSVFAGYEIVQKLGAGAFGVVYEAVGRGGGRRVALKVLRTDAQTNKDAVARFLREARAVALLKHPNIVQAVELGEHDGHGFLAMEFLAGETLSALMRREKRLPLPCALDIVIPLMAAVRTVHAQGIVHRDIKPDNVFVTYTEDCTICPKLLDFGAAKMAEPGLQLTGKDDAIGTPNFMSPEQMLSPRSVDPRSDQWGLGVLLYYMLTGTKPFKGKNLAETLSLVLHHEPTPLYELAPEVPRSVAAAIMRAMCKPPDRRFGSVHDFAQSLLRFTSDATALVYATEFYTVSVWEALGEEPPSHAPASRAPRRSRPAPPPHPAPSRPPDPATRAAAVRVSRASERPDVAPYDESELTILTSIAPRQSLVGPFIAVLLLVVAIAAAFYRLLS